MAITNNSLQGFLAVFAQKSLDQLISDAPFLNFVTKDFSDTISQGGISFTTRINTTAFGSTLNNLGTNGWSNTRTTASAVTGILNTKGPDTSFNENEWATITPTTLQNTVFPSLTKTLANGIFVEALNNVSSSVFTNVQLIPSSSLYSVFSTANSAISASAALTRLEVPKGERYLITTPELMLAMSKDIIPQYVYGDTTARKGTTGLKFANFDYVTEYPRFNGAFASGGSVYGNTDKLVGIAGHPDGIVVAMRAPIEPNNGLVQSYTAVDKATGISVQARIIYDTSGPVWRLATVSCFGTAAGNTKAIIPIITQTV